MSLPSSLDAHPWAVLPSALPLCLPSVAPTAVSRPSQTSPRRHSSVSVVPVQGILVPRCDGWMEDHGYLCSTERLVGRVAAAADSSETVVLLFDSPGGSVSGIAEAASGIAEIGETARIVSCVSYLAASAAYHLASQTEMIVVTPSGQVGSIGVVTVAQSAVRALESDGIDTVVIAEGAGKTDGHPLVEITEGAVERLSDTVTVFYDQFVSAVAAGRGVEESTVRDVWGARVLTAEAAVSAGMADEVASVDDCIAGLVAGSQTSAVALPAPPAAAAHRQSTGHTTRPAIVTTTRKGVSPMSEPAPPAPPADTLVADTAREITASLVPGASAAITEQVMAQINARLDDMTKTAASDLGSGEVAAIRRDLDQLTAALATQPPDKPGRRVTAESLLDDIRIESHNPTLFAASGDGRFSRFSEFVLATIQAGKGLGHDPRLLGAETPEVAAALTGEELSLGGALVPEEYRAALMSLMLMDSAIRSRVTAIPMGSSTLAMPTVRDKSHTDLSVFGGVRSYWLENGVDARESQPEFGLTRLTAKTLVTYTALFNSMIADSSVSIPMITGSMFAASHRWTEERSILRGNGVGEPLGILNSPVLLTVARETANQIGFEDILAMEDAVLPESEPYLVYLVGPRVRSSVIRILKDVEGPESARSMMGATTLLGRPVIPCEHLPVIGSQGDIMLVDLRFYLWGDRQAMTMGLSTDELFASGQTAIRSTSRSDGQPWLSSTLELADGTDVSPFVTLRATTS